MRPLIREATSSDDGVMHAIALEGDAAADAGYLALLRSQGARLLVAEVEGRVVAFGGVVDVDAVSMLSDLFVAGDAPAPASGPCCFRICSTARHTG